MTSFRQMMEPLSHKASRFKVIKPHYDLIVVGGGIYGAALLWEATHRGLSCILLERGDFAGGASGNSLKIIHGGIRYLQKLDVPRIRSSAREQLFFLNKMPHLVKPLSCVSPCYGYGFQGRSAYQLAFWIYDALIADIRKRLNGKASLLPSGQILPPDKLPQMFPNLNLQRHSGAAKWYDAIALDTERIVLNLIQEACHKGNHAFNYLEMQSFLTEGTRVVGVKAKDGLEDEELSIFADHVVTCTGDASMDLKNLAVPETVFGRLRFAKAVNVVVSRTAADCALALRTKWAGRKNGLGRLLFFVPWQNATIIGTWYFRCNTDKNDRHLREAELDFILAQINTAYPALEVTTNDVTYIYLGRLPALPRETPTWEPKLLEHGLLIDHGRSSGWHGLWSVVGVKYTTARAVAERVLGRIFGKQGKERLIKSECAHPEACQYRVRKAHETQINPEGSKDWKDKPLSQLSAAFDRRAIEVNAWVGDDPSMLSVVPGWDALSQAAIHYAIQHESVWHLTDLLLRRSNIGASTRPAQETIDWALDHLGRHLGWNEAQKQREIKMLDEHYNWWR